MSPEITDFKQQISKFPPEKYGSAEMSSTERKALKGLYSSLRESMYGEEELNKSKRGELRDAITESVVNDGWPELINLSTNDLAETAVAHACVVAEHLFEKRGETATPDTIWSYATKNQFDRYIYKLLMKSGKLNKGSKLHEEWNDPNKRMSPKNPEIIDYPEKVDDTKIHGVGKPERYWPSQLTRYLEAIRLGKASESELIKYKVGKTNPETYKIPWENYSDVVGSAETTEDITVGIAIKTLSTLKERGLSSEQLVATIMAGYSPGGPITEHGNVPAIGSVWKRIVSEVRNDSYLSEIHSDLVESATKKFNELNYSIKFE